MYQNQIASSGKVATSRSESTLSVERLETAVAELFQALGSALQDELGSAEECLARAGAILQIRPSARVISAEPMPENGNATTPVRRGLAPWQVRKVAAHIEQCLDTPLRNLDLARLARLSPFHFSRAFRDSFGDSPHGYIIRRRMERAQGMMLSTDAPLSQIAAECGLSDQAHLNKLFRRVVGESPAAWRRARTSERAGNASLNARNEVG